MVIPFIFFHFECSMELVKLENLLYFLAGKKFRGGGDLRPPRHLTQPIPPWLSFQLLTPPKLGLN